MCGRAISTLRSVRQRLTEYSLSSSSKGKGQRKERVHPWTVRLFCLSDTSQCKVPSTACLKILLLGAGLGEMSVKVPDVNSCSMEDLREIIVKTYPKLRDCGGFEMLRCANNSKDLIVLEGKLTQSVKILKTVIGAGRLYLRPIQKNLDMTTVEDLEWESDEVCHQYNYSTAVDTFVSL